MCENGAWVQRGEIGFNGGLMVKSALVLWSFNGILFCVRSKQSDFL